MFIIVGVEVFFGVCDRYMRKCNGYVFVVVMVVVVVVCGHCHGGCGGAWVLFTFCACSLQVIHVC